MQRSLLLLILVTLSAATVQAQPLEHRAGLVVQYTDGAVQTACVRFSEPEISGIDMLGRAGLPVIAQASPFGEAVCKIGDTGCNYPAEGCFCKREGPRAIYWAFYTLADGAWQYSNQSASKVMAHDGDVQGWAWGLGESGSGAQPPVIDLETICSAPPAVAPTEAPIVATVVPTKGAEETTATALAAPAVSTQTNPAQGNYLAFGLLALVLIAGVTFAILRRRS